MLGLLLLVLVATCAAVAGAEDNWLVGCWLLLVTINTAAPWRTGNRSAVVCQIWRAFLARYQCMIVPISS